VRVDGWRQPCRDDDRHGLLISSLVSYTATSESPRLAERVGGANGVAAGVH